MKLIIQIPCYNEAETLTIALNELPRHIDGIDAIEYLIINDGSRCDCRGCKILGVNYIVYQNKIEDWPKDLWQDWMRVCVTGQTLL